VFLCGDARDDEVEETRHRHQILETMTWPQASQPSVGHGLSQPAVGVGPRPNRFNRFDVARARKTIRE